MATAKKTQTAKKDNEMDKQEEDLKAQLGEGDGSAEPAKDDENFLDTSKNNQPNSLEGKDKANAVKPGQSVNPPPKPTGEKNREIPRIKPNDANVYSATVRQIGAIAPAGTQRSDLEKPEFYEHIAGRLELATEIRVWAEDGAFVAYCIVVFKHANVVRCKVLSFHELENISYKTAAEFDRYEVKNRGIRKWGIVDTKDGTVIRENIPTQAEAYNALAEFRQMLNR